MIFNEANSWATGAVCALMLIDLFTGWLQSMVNKTFESSIMRVGICHKMLMLCLLVVAYVIEAASAHVEGLGFMEITVIVVCIPMVVMEVGSICENVVKGNPALKDTPLIKLFIKNEDGTTD